MLSSDLHDRAAIYRRYTGASAQVAAQAVRAQAPGTAVIPEAVEQDQVLLETETVYWLLQSHPAFTEYPLGLAYVAPTPTGLRAHLESQTRADELFAGMLPCWQPGGEVHGMSGLRIRQRTEAGLELHRLGTRTSLWLTGLSSFAFDRAERDLYDRITALGWEASWRQPQWTEAEQRWEAELQPLITMPAIRDWVRILSRDS